MDKIFTRSSLIVLLITFFTIFAGSQEEIFLRANKLYKQKQYNNALELYQSMNEKGPAVWENIGFCFYMMKDYVHALVALKRAEKIASQKQCFALQKYIEIIKNNLGFTVNNNWASYIYTYLKCITSGLSLLLLQLLFLLIWYVMFFFLLNNMYSARNILLFLFLVLCTIIFGSAIYIKYQLYTKINGIVIAKNEPIFTGPDTQFDRLSELKNGQEVIVSAKRLGWYKIYDNSITGWVRADAIETI